MSLAPPDWKGLKPRRTLKYEWQARAHKEALEAARPWSPPYGPEPRPIGGV